MKTAEVAIEHVLTGLLALCAFIVPLSDVTAQTMSSLNSEGIIGILGLAYLIGVVFDKVADTVLSPLEWSIRVRQVEKLRAGNEQGEPDDPFPQDRLEFRLRENDNAQVDWLDSLRSRIRTCRGLAVLGAPASVGASAVLDAGAGEPDPKVVALGTLILLGGAVLLAALPTLKLPKTYKLPGKNSRAKLVIRMLPYVAFLVFILAFSLGNWATLAGRVSAGGVAMSVIALWAWWRISTTHMKFVSETIRAPLLTSS